MDEVQCLAMTEEVRAATLRGDDVASRRAIGIL